jgi:large subunit ribosomal protein L10
MNREEKKAAIQGLSETLGASTNVYVLGFRGINVADATELRRQVRGAGSRYLVVKNTLALRAIHGTPLEPMSEQFEGETAVAFTADHPVALAKVLVGFAKSNPNLVFKAAVVEGRVVPGAEIRAIAELPTREELVAKLLYLMQSPLRRLVTVLNGPVRNLASTLHQIAEKKNPSAPESGAGVQA